MAQKGPDYIVELGLDATKLEKEYPKVFSKLEKAQRSLNKLLDTQLAMTRQLVGTRKQEAAELLRIITLQQKLNGLQGKHSAIATKGNTAANAIAASTRSKNPAAPKQKADPFSLSERTKATFGARVGYEADRGRNVTEPSLVSQLEASRNSLRALHKEIQDTSDVRSLVKLRERFKEINGEIRNTVAQQRALNKVVEAKPKAALAPKDPLGVSERTKATFGARVGYEISRGRDITDPGLKSQIDSSRQALRQLQKEIASTSNVRSLAMLRERFKDIRNEIISAEQSQRKLNKAMDKGNFIAGKLTASLKSAALAYVSAYAAIGAGKQIFTIGKEFDAMQASLLAASDNAEAAKMNFEFLVDTAKSLGTDLSAGAGGFNKLGAAMKGSKFAAEEIKEVYLASQEASSTLGLTADNNKSVILALSQMASKGKITAEEFTSQLSERMPIAMQAMEKATGKTAAEIFDMMKRGELSTKKYLLPWAKAVREIVRQNGALESASTKLTAEQNRLNTAYKEMINEVFQEGGANSLSEMFKELTKFVVENRKEIKALISGILDGVVGFVKITVAAANFAVELGNIVGKLLSFGTASNGIKFITSLFYEFLAVIYKVQLALQIVADMATLDFKSLWQFHNKSEAVKLKATRETFNRNSAAMLSRNEVLRNKLIEQGKIQAPPEKPVAQIGKIEYHNHTADPKKSMMEFDRYVQEQLPNLFSY